ncbi:MAG: winged helix-turn-helix domain-containing protein, partial [Propionicimonas sp.]|nr:winged helix-turn-helix domain-containing protein [Propionicimonas sp.]
MKAYEAVRKHLEDQILAGELTVGSLLPAERELATEFGVSRAAVREALRMMAAQGLITSQVGAGPNSGTRITAQNGP